MRYIADSSGYVKEVSFGADITCEGADCAGYAGSVPEGYASLEAWYLAEAEKLYRWKVVGGNLVLDSTATAPVDYGCADYVIEAGKEDDWHWRKWASGVSELWGFYDVTGAACTTASGAMFVTGQIVPGISFPSGLFAAGVRNMQMTFNSYQGTPAIIWCDGGVNEAAGVTSFRLMRHTAATVSGRMHYTYTGFWR